jgi:hypothetical protein
VSEKSVEKIPVDDHRIPDILDRLVELEVNKGRLAESRLIDLE